MSVANKKSDRMAWYKMDAGAFLADTRGLPLVRVGIYGCLLNLYWTSGNTLPTDEEILRRKVGVANDEEAQAMKDVLNEFFPGGSHEGLDNQLTSVQVESKKKAENARKAHVSRKPASPVSANPAQDDDF